MSAEISKIKAKLNERKCTLLEAGHDNLVLQQMVSTIKDEALVKAEHNDLVLQEMTSTMK